MAEINAPLPELSNLLEQRLSLLCSLAESLEFSTLALAQNDAQAIARGAAHQAELCRQWSCFEDQLRPHAISGSTRRLAREFDHAQGIRSARLQAEFETVTAHIRYLTRVHYSLLRHLQRSLAVLNRVVDSCAPTYTPDRGMLRMVVRPVSEQSIGE
jgi:hypothetical protein